MLHVDHLGAGRCKNVIAASIALGVSLYIGLHIASAATGKNFYTTFEKRLVSLLPGEKTKASDQKAWVTRLPAIRAELQMWMQNPLIGQFAVEESTGWGGAAEVGFGFHHNAYTSTLAQTGLIGFAGLMMAVYCPIILGFKLVRMKWDRTSTLIGGLGFSCGVIQAVLGMATASFHGYRVAMLIVLVSGIVFRVTDLVRTEQRLAMEAAARPDDLSAFEPVAIGVNDIPDFDDWGRPVGGYQPGYN
jgi:hypothetical protein